MSASKEDQKAGDGHAAYLKAKKEWCQGLANEYGVPLHFVEQASGALYDAVHAPTQ